VQVFTHRGSFRRRRRWLLSGYYWRPCPAVVRDHAWAGQIRTRLWYPPAPPALEINLVRVLPVLPGSPWKLTSFGFSPVRVLPLSRRLATIHRRVAAGDVPAIVARVEGDHPGDVLRLPGASQRDGREDLRPELRGQVRGALGVGEPRRD